MGRNSKWAIPLAGLVILGALAAPAGAQQTTVSVGVNARFLSGSFGSDQTTDLLYAPAVLRIDSGRFEVAASFPYLTIRNGTVAPSQGGFIPMRGTLRDAPTTGLSMGAGGMMGRSPGGGSTSAPIDPGATPVTLLVTDQSGFGDVVASAGYRLVDDQTRGLHVTLSGRVKVPTASAAQGLGTGKADLGAVGTVRKQFASGWVYAEGGYLAIGDPDGIDLRNATLWSVGGGRRLTDRVGLLVSAYGNTAILPEFGAPLEVGGGVGLRVGHTTLTIIPTVGVSDASPRYAVNVGLSSEVFRR